jgi:ATP-dependent exoDNAse (exonuclease V) beta subunit
MPTLTNSQLRVIASTASRLLVDAGAGSGKTTTVVQAICHQLGVTVPQEPPIAPVASPLTFEQIAAITFTNQSAADLKRKMRAALRAGGRRDLASEVDSSRIGTIHSFCGDVLRDFALRAGVRPGRRVLDEGEGASIARECAREALHAAIEGGGVTGLQELLTGRRLKDVTPWIEKIASDADRLAHWDAHRDTLRPHEVAVLEIATRAKALRNEWLDREGLLDFDRMIVETRDLLQHEAVRHAVQQRIRLLVLDEFQDVDPAQRDIAFLLGGLLHDDPSPTRIILVGDPKQSIYRFRRADVTLWNAVAARFRDGAGVVLPLSDNFRSKAAILGMVDHAVGRVLGSAGAGERREFEVDYQPLAPRAEQAEGDRAVEFLLVPPSADGEKARSAADVRNLEATAVARRITEMATNGTPYGDIAILLAGWGDVERYVEALNNAGVPTYLLRSEGFWDDRAVLDCIRALRAVRDPADDVAMVGFLKSPFVGVRDDTLLALARRANGAPIGGALADVAVERALLDRASALLQRLREVRDRVSVHELISRLVWESGFFGVLGLDARSGQQAVANVRKLIRMASMTPGQSLGEFLRTVGEQRERKDRVAPERLHRERSNVVTVTSIHSAKGLEWPIVFWCDLVRGVAPEKEKCITGRDAFRVKQTAGDEDEDPVFAAMLEELALEERAEAARLWYVASTRAKTRLVLSGVPLGKRAPGSPAEMFCEVFPSLGVGSEIEYQSADGTTYHATTSLCDGVAAPDAPVVEGVGDLSLPPERVRVSAGRTRLSATQLMQFAHDPEHWWNRSVRRFAASGGGSSAGGSGAGGSGAGGVSRADAGAIATGVIVHAVLERLERDSTDLDDLIESVSAGGDGSTGSDGDQPALDNPLRLAWRAYIRERVEAAANSPVWREVAEQTSARRELSFTRVLADGTTINGALDLASMDDRSARIVDVKSSSAGAGALAERYSIQAAIYADAARAIGGASDVRFTLVSVPSGATTDVVPTDDVPALVMAVRAWAGGG